MTSYREYPTRPKEPTKEQIHQFKERCYSQLPCPCLVENNWIEANGCEIYISSKEIANNPIEAADKAIKELKHRINFEPILKQKADAFWQEYKALVNKHGMRLAYDTCVYADEVAPSEPMEDDEEFVLEYESIAEPKLIKEVIGYDYEQVERQVEATNILAAIHKEVNRDSKKQTPEL